jgi:glycine oxidase
MLATGHYRNGILLSPVTADAIVACLTGQPPAAEWEPFTPGRFIAERPAAERPVAVPSAAGRAAAGGGSR